jgi:Tetratricopeptide repeat/PEGA domain
VRSPIPLALAWVLSLTGFTAVARADGRDPAAAEALFRQGRAAAQKGDWESACPKLRESQRLDPAAGTLLNLADCEEHRGKVATAWQLFRQVVESLPESDERVPLAKKRAADLEKRLPHLTVNFGGTAPPGTKVARNEVDLAEASLGSPLPVDPGTYQIVVTAPGYQTTNNEVVVAEAANVTIDVRVGARLAGDETRPAPRPSNRTAAWVVGGIGVAGLGVGAVAGILTLDRKGTVDDNCNADKRCNPTGYDAAQSGKTLGMVTTTGIVVGVIGVGVGAYLLLSDEKTNHPTVVTAGWSQDGASLVLRRGW